MAKRKSTASNSVEGADDTVTINLPEDNTFNQSTFLVSGTSTPSNATVLGTLTNKSDFTRIASTPPSVICAQNPADATLGDWTLQFSNVPKGDYILAVNQGLGNGGADAVNATVIPDLPQPQLGLSLSTSAGSTTATVTNPSSTTPLLVSVVAVASKPKHGAPKHKIVAPLDSETFKFTPALAIDTKVTAFAVGANVKGNSKKVT